MYIPKYFKEDNLELIEEVLIQYSFATLITVHNNKPIISHIPLEYIKENNEQFLLGHLSLGNQQWKLIQNNKDVVAIFQGPNSYITSKWYDHMNVPTWNYVAIHVTGDAEIISDREELVKILKMQIDKYESGRENPLRFDDFTKEFLDEEIKGVIGIRIRVKNLEANFKLSQNRDMKNFDNIIGQLQKSENISACPVADLMKKQKHKIE